MCGRYVRRSDKQAIAEYFRASPQPAELPMPGADYNVAPTTLPAHHPPKQGIDRTRNRPRTLGGGLVPFFTKQLSDIKGLFHHQRPLRSITTAPTWREPMKKRCCIVPANSFYEWVRPESRPDDCPACHATGPAVPSAVP